MLEVWQVIYVYDLENHWEYHYFSKSYMVSWFQWKETFLIGEEGNQTTLSSIKTPYTTLWNCYDFNENGEIVTDSSWKPIAYWESIVVSYKHWVEYFYFSHYNVKEKVVYVEQPITEDCFPITICWDFISFKSEKC